MSQKTALIVGAGSGLSASLARLFHAQGLDLKCQFNARDHLGNADGGPTSGVNGGHQSCDCYGKCCCRDEGDPFAEVLIDPASQRDCDGTCEGQS